MTNPVLECMNNRVSLRTYDDGPVTDEELQAILEAAMRAPTAGNQMLYSIIVIRNQETKEKLSKSCDNQPFIAKAPVLLLFVADQHKWFDFYKKNGVKEFCEEQKGKGFCFEAPQESDLILASEDTMIAAQNAVIAAESLGILSVILEILWKTMNITKSYLTFQSMYSRFPCCAWAIINRIIIGCSGNGLIRNLWYLRRNTISSQMKNTKRCLKRNAKNTVQTIHMALIIMPRCFMPEKPELLSAKKWLDRFVWR